MEDGVTGVLMDPVPMPGKWPTFRFKSKFLFRDGKSTCTQSRFRFCNNPVPSRGGMHCQGSSAEMRDCSSNIDGDSHEQCVIHGGWSDWSTGSVCSSECQTTKTRTCTSPTPINSKVLLFVYSYTYLQQCWAQGTWDFNGTGDLLSLIFLLKACEGESSLTTSCTGGRCNSGNSGEVTSPGKQIDTDLYFT